MSRVTWVLAFLLLVVTGYSVYATEQITTLESRLSFATKRIAKLESTPSFTVVSKDEPQVVGPVGIAGYEGWDEFRGCLHYEAFGTIQAKCMEWVEPVTAEAQRRAPTPDRPTNADCLSEARVGLPLPQVCR